MLPDACNEFAGAHFQVIGPCQIIAPFQEMLQGWRAIGNAVSNFTDPRFEPKTFRFRDESVTARLNARYLSRYYRQYFEGALITEIFVKVHVRNTYFVSG